LCWPKKDKAPARRGGTRQQRQQGKEPASKTQKHIRQNPTPMNWPYELQIGWRYTRAGRAGRRNRFISFISGVAMLGIALGVAALIIVLSVMNGFQKEVRDRMLGVVSHVEIYGPGGGPLADVNQTIAQARRNPQVIGAAPFVASQALLARGEGMRRAIGRGIA